MLNFFKSLFNGPIEKYPTGALEGLVDTRTIELAQFQAPVALPDDFEHQLGEPRNQGSRQKCVGSANRKIVEWKFKQQEIAIDLSDDDLYDQCKLIDGIPLQEGTFPLMAPKVICNTGVASTAIYQTGDKEKIKEDRRKYKLSGFATPTLDFMSICQAIYQNGPVSAAFYIDTNWFKGIIMRILKILSRHDVVLNGAIVSKEILKGQNSWGNEWIGYIAGVFDKNVKPGHFQMKWGDVANTIGDVIAYTDIPQDILDLAKGQCYQFTKTMRIGSTGYEVSQLQKRLYLALTDGKFGPGTEKAVIAWQKAQGLGADGVFGPNSIKKMNSLCQKKSL